MSDIKKFQYPIFSAYFAVISAPVGSRRRARALRIWLRLSKTIEEVRSVYRFAEPGSGFEHRVVVKWVRLAEQEGTKEALIEVLEKVRGLKRSSRLERRILGRLRRLGYRDWAEKVGDFFRSFSLVRKPA